MSSRKHASSIQNSEFRIQKSTGAAIAVALLLICSTVAHLGAQVQESLFADAPPGLAVPATADQRPFFVRSRTVVLQVAALDRALASPATSSFTLNLFDDASFAVTFERSENSILGHRTWAGQLTGRPFSNVTLTMKDGVVLGMVTDGTALYEIHGLGDGLHRIDQMDMSLMQPERDIVVPAPSGGAADEAPPGPAASAPTVVSTVDIFVYYSTTLKNTIGLPAVQGRISQYIANANTAYARSGIEGQLQLVGAAEIDAPESADSGDLLDAFSVDPTVVNQRNVSKADLVALLVGSLGADPGFLSCGIGHVGVNGAGSSSAAFSITASDSNCVYTFVHEVGHNLGAQHAVEDVLLTGPEYPTYARAHKVPNVFRTVMAYQCPGAGDTCPRVLNFSNPGVVESGQPTGITNQRENARRLNELFAQVAAYRAGSPPPLLSAPQNLQAITNGFNVTLQWQAPASGTPTNFVVAGGTGPGLTNIGVVPVGLTLSVSAALPAGAYFVRVYAQNATGSSPASNEVSFTLGATSPPGPPLNLTSNVVGGTLSLAWQPPSSGGAPSAYLIDAGTASGLSNLVAGFPIAGTALTVPGAPTGRFFIRVRSRNAIGTSAPSNEVDVTIGPSCTLPSAPQNFTVTKNGVIVTVSWSAPAVGTPSTYIVQAGSSSGAANLFNGSVGLTTSLSAQAPPGAYFLRALAANACGTGPATGEIAITVP